MKRSTLALLLGLLCCGAAQAAIIDLDNDHAARVPVSALSVVNRSGPTLPSQVSELPEPEVLAMMVAGLVLIGFRVSRDSSDTFK